MNVAVEIRYRPIRYPDLPNSWNTWNQVEHISFFTYCNFVESHRNILFSFPQKSQKSKMLFSVICLQACSPVHWLRGHARVRGRLPRQPRRPGRRLHQGPRRHPQVQEEAMGAHDTGAKHIQRKDQR